MNSTIKKIENSMIYVMIILSFLMYSSLTQNTKIISIIIWPTVLLSLLCIIYRVIHNKDYKINSLHKYLLLFLMSYFFSSVLNIKYGYYQNLRTLVLMAMIIGIVYTKSKNEEQSEKIIVKVTKTFLIITTVLSFATLLIFNISQIFINVFGTEIYITGLRWGRIKGLYNDFNYGGIINSIAILIAIFFLNYDNTKRIKKMLYLLTILINFTFIALSDSRTSIISLILGITLFGIIYGIPHVKGQNKKTIKMIMSLIVILVLIFVGKNIIKTIFSIVYDNEEERVVINIDKKISIEKRVNEEKTNAIESKIDKTEYNKSNKEEKNEIKEKHIPNITDNSKKENIFDRGHSNGDISNRRFDLWKSSVEIFKTKPIMGVSFENIENYCYKNLPNTYLINNNYKKFDNFHNLIFNVLASQGIVGLLVLITIIFHTSVNILTYINFLFKQNENDNLIAALLISCILIGFISSMFIGDIIYYISPSTVIFWFCLGYIMNDIEKIRQKKESTISRAIKKFNRICWIRIFNCFHVKDNKIILDNFTGKGYGDNCKYIIEEINRRNLKYDLVWILKNPEDKKTLPANVRFVKYNSIKYFYDICTSKIWIDNHRKIIDLRKRKEQYYIQTWHGGIALKKVEKDAQNALDPKYIKQAIHDSKMIDLMISNSKFCTEMYKRAFWYEGAILECGSPRNDIIINFNTINKGDIYDKLKINKSKRIILYAPTFRKNENLECYDIDFEKLVNQLNKKTGNDWIVALRLHPNIAQKSKEIFKNKKYSNVIDVSNYPDMYELMVISDILITDYSSVMFEFSLKNKPVFLYAKDVKEYINDRGFYFDYYKLPYTVSTNNEELRKNIENHNPDTYKEELNRFFEKLEIHEQGNASSIIVDIIENKLKGD